MSDTSGSRGLGPAGRDVRSSLKSHFAGGASRRQKGNSAAGGSALLAEIMWQPLDEHDLLEAVLLPDELVYYLEQITTFIDTAKRSGLEAVAKALDVREASMFPSARRVIKLRAPGNSGSRRKGSEHHDRAGAAFDSGSAYWAAELSGVDDPTQIPLRALVDRIRDGDEYDRALLLSARRIIQEYGDRVIAAAIREDDSFRRAANKQLIDAFHKQLDRFFAQHSSPSEWTAARVRTTVERLPDFLKR